MRLNCTLEEKRMNTLDVLQGYTIKSKVDKIPFQQMTRQKGVILKTQVHQKLSDETLQGIGSQLQRCLK